MRKVKFLCFHHSCSPRDNTSVSDIKRWHRERGWAVPGYHKIIQPNGKIANILSVEKESNGVWGRNKDLINVCVIGNFTKETPTNKQLKAMEKLTEKLTEKYKDLEIVGHTEIALEGHQTKCPGCLLEEIDKLREKYKQIKPIEKIIPKPLPPTVIIAVEKQKKDPIRSIFEWFMIQLKKVLENFQKLKK